MNREYTSGTHKGVNFFVGTEIEKTPAYGKRTLFVTGVHPIDIIRSFATNKKVEHIYFGANQSFNVANENDFEGWDAWESMIRPFLKEGMLCTLDLDVKHLEGLLEGGLCEFNTFIPQISVKVPYIKHLNYNACIKIDDKDFNATNPGVWVHRVHDLMSYSTFNDWTDYSQDEVIG